MHNLGKNIKKLRKERRISQTELAYHVNIPSQSKISAWENGTHIPNILEARKIATFFEVSLDYLLGYD